MLTNTQSAQVIEELIKAAADSGEPVTITPVDEGALRAGAEALLEVEKLRVDLAEEAQVHQRIRAAKNQFVEERNAAQREVERLRGVIQGVHEGAARMLADSGPREDFAYALNAIYQDCESALAGLSTPDARDARIAELEAALRSVKETWVKWPPSTESLAHQEHFNRGIIEPVDAALKEGSDE